MKILGRLIAENLAKCSSQLRTAREMYERTKDEAWFAKAYRLRKRMEELECMNAGLIPGLR